MAFSSKDVIAGVFKVADKTSGRDRICRLLQYGSRFVSWVLEQEAVTPDLVKKLRDLENSISTARKLFRLGKSVDNFRGALQTVHLSNPILRLLITLVKLNRGIYLFFDHLIWVGRMRLATIDLGYWGRVSNRFWVLTIFLGLLRDLYELVITLRAEMKRMSSSTSQALGNVVRNNPALVLDVVKNGADFWIPVSRLDIVYLPSGIVGLLGVVSSIAGLISVWNEHLKLKFS